MGAGDRKTLENRRQAVHLLCVDRPPLALHRGAKLREGGSNQGESCASRIIAVVPHRARLSRLIWCGTTFSLWWSGAASRRRVGIIGVSARRRKRYSISSGLIFFSTGSIRCLYPCGSIWWYCPFGSAAQVPSLFW